MSLRSTHRLAPADSGETLIEILIAVAIMTVVMVGLIQALTTGVLATDTHRRLTDVEVVARAYGESLVGQFNHPASSTITAVPDATHITVANAGVFGSAPFGIAVEAEVLQVSGVSGNTLALTNAAQFTHTVGATVTGYNSCPTAAQLAPTFTVPAQAKKINAPTITNVEYFTSVSDIGTPISGSCGTNDSGSGFWSTTIPCSKFSPPVHYTTCDPPLIRVTVTTTSSDTGTSGKQATTVTRVLLRRGNA